MASRTTQPSARPVGQTQGVGFNVGARRTFALTPAQAWDWVVSPAGVAVWLGRVVDRLPHQPQATYTTRDGAEGEIRVFESGSHLRLTWKPKGWKKPSLIQVRVRPAAGGATIAFHQEHLSGSRARTEMRTRWLAVLDEMEAAFGQS